MAEAKEREQVASSATPKPAAAVESWEDDPELDRIMAEAEAREGLGAETAARRAAIEGATEAEFVEVLEEVWGHESLREGQLAALEAVAAGRDGGVYWATGSGKSLVYQLPAMVARRRGERKTALVISPLISLMQDQVTAMNTLVGEDVACFLGSAQTDNAVEERALRGEYPLVYATPEKATSGALCAALGDRLLLVAIDEAHCVSEYGHDFRPEYRSLGRLRGARVSAPLLALTATATPRIRRDVETNLGLRPGFFVAIKSVDRPNLRITCQRKTSALTKDAILKKLSVAVQSSKNGPTIVYCATRREVDDAVAGLRARLPPEVQDQVVGYHAGHSAPQRADAHEAFLVGRASVVVATSAFGMGIDKADVRRVVHLGPPKTFEGYYQMIGRAGRDGKPADCDMYFASSDFDKYESDFYLGGLQPEAKEAVRASTRALRSFAEAGVDACRRALVVDYFAGANGGDRWRCGTCDLCAAAGDAAGESASRDFTPQARLVATVVVNVSGGAAMTDLSTVAAGGMVAGEDWKVRRFQKAVAAVARLREEEEELDAKDHPKKKHRCTKDDVKDWLVPAMLKRGLLVAEQRRSNAHARAWSYNVYLPGGAPCAALAAGTSTFLAPPPLALLEKERAEKKIAEERVSELARSGVDVANIPQEELEAGAGPAIRAELKWIRALASWRANGKQDKADKYEAVLARILAWRDAQARQHKLAPVNVLADYVAKRVAYSLPGTVADLRAVGVRHAVGIADLAAVIQDSVEQLELRTAVAAGCAPVIALPRDARWRPPNKWALAKAPNPKKKANFEISYERFQEKGQSIAAIATDQLNGKPILQNTVVGHLLTALAHGRPLDVQRLQEQAAAILPDPCGAPTTQVWTRLEDALAACADTVDVVGAERYDAKTLARAYGGDAAACAEIDYKERTPQQQQVCSSFWNDVRWFTTLKRVGYDPTSGQSEPPAKRLKSPGPS